MSVFALPLPPAFQRHECGVRSQYQISAYRDHRPAHPAHSILQQYNSTVREAVGPAIIPVSVVSVPLSRSPGTLCSPEYEIAESLCWAGSVRQQTDLKNSTAMGHQNYLVERTWDSGPQKIHFRHECVDRLKIGKNRQKIHVKRGQFAGRQRLRRTQSVLTGRGSFYSVRRVSGFQLDLQRRLCRTRPVRSAKLR